MADKMTLTDYMALDYPIELIRDNAQGGFFARHPDLLGCTAEGNTAEEAVSNLNESRELWIETRLESGYPVPVPPGDEYGGRISLRIPRGLHAFLARSSVRQGLSLNQLLTVILSNRASGKSVRDTVAEELGPLVRAALSSPESMTVTTETKTETIFQLLEGGGTGPRVSAQGGH